MRTCANFISAQKQHWLALAVISFCLVNCGGDSGTSFLGVYSIDSWTENEAGCDTDGDSVLANRAESHFYVKNVDFLGRSSVNVDRCASLTECATEQNDSSLIGSFDFEKGSDSAGRTGEIVFAGSTNGTDLCQGILRSLTLTETSDGVVRIQIEKREAENIPKDSEGFCNTDAVKKAAKDTPCLSIEVFSGLIVPE